VRRYRAMPKTGRASKSCRMRVIGPERYTF
jgi:hypothetical protein